MTTTQTGCDRCDERDQYNRFTFGDRRFDLEAAAKLVAGRDTFDIQTERPPMWIRWDRDHAGHVDLEHPVLLATLTFEDGTTGTLLIDGWHRLAKAADAGQESIAAHLLTADETKAIETRG